MPAVRRTPRGPRGAWVLVYALATLVIALLCGSAPGWDVLVAPVGSRRRRDRARRRDPARPDAPRVGELTSALDPTSRPSCGWAPGGPAGRRAARGISSIVLGVWVVAGRASAGDIIVGLAPGAVGGLILAVAQVAVVPNLVLWVSSWIAGPGFVVGEGSSFTTSASDPGALPAIPLLGSLPGPEWNTVLASFAPRSSWSLVWSRGVRLAPMRRARRTLVRPRARGAGCGTGLGTARGGLAGGGGRRRRAGTDGSRRGPAAARRGLVAAEIAGGAVLALLWGKAAITGRVRHREEATEPDAAPPWSTDLARGVGRGRGDRGRGPRGYWPSRSLVHCSRACSYRTVHSCWASTVIAPSRQAWCSISTSHIARPPSIESDMVAVRPSPTATAGSSAPPSRARQTVRRARTPNTIVTTAKNRLATRHGKASELVTSVTSISRPKCST
ncbi:DUF6350 family protein [Oerskovia sp. M15]